MNRFIAFTITCLLVFQISFGQIVLNEALSSNKSTVYDEDGNYSDWIELYNKGLHLVDLSSFYLTDNKADLQKWHFGDATLAPDKHLLVFASGKDKSFTTTVEKTLSGLGNNFYAYSDSEDPNQTNLGSTIEPWLYKGIQGIENGKTVYAARVNLANNASTLGFSYAGFFIQHGNWAELHNMSDFNTITINANISAGKVVQFRVVQDGLDSWLGFAKDLIGSGKDSTYTIPLYKNGRGLDLTKIKGIQFEINAPHFGITEFKITDVSWESRSKIEALSEKSYAYSDKNETPPGGSSVTPYEFPSISANINGRNALSATINYANNAGVLAFSYANIEARIFDWEDSLDLSGYLFLEVKAKIQANRKIKVALLQHGVENWLSYFKELTGNGSDSTYLIPLTGNVSPLDLSRLKGLAIQGTMPYGPTSFTIYEMNFVKQIGLGEGHTNFKLAADGESVYLTDGVTIIDSIQIPRLLNDLSYGRATDGNVNWVIFETPTPRSPNSGQGFTGYCASEVLTNQAPGFYATPITLSLSGSDNIRYTTDGSTPTFNSPIYTSPITLTTTTVVRAGCFSNNTLPQFITTGTYIVGETTELPVFSISTHPDNLFDFNKGILADGPGWTEDQPHFGANFWQDWKRLAHIEFFDETKALKLKQDIDIKVFGGWSRANAQKSFQLKSNSDYGKNDIAYPFFAPHKNMSSFKDLVLRNSGNDFNQELFHDAINHVALRNSTHHLDYLEYLPCVVYLNGEYWGIMNLREKINQHYIDDNHGYKSAEVELYDAWGQDIHNANTADFNTIATQIATADMRIQSNFDKYANYFDMDNMIDFMATNMFISNWDWPQNNLKFWRPIKNGIPGKFRYILFDTDISLGKFDLQDANFNQIDRMLNDQTIGPHGKIFSSFMKNTTFRNNFINRAADLMNTVLNEQHYNTVINELENAIANEVPKHQEKWIPWVSWEDAKQGTRDFLSVRQTTAWSQLKDIYDLPSINSITINVNKSEAGLININSLTPQTLPWSGNYFESVLVQLSPKPYLGFTFSHWETSIGSFTEDTLYLNPNTNISVTAIFEGEVSELTLTISEINYNSSETLDLSDYVEFYNYGDKPLDLGNFVFKDEDDFHQFIIPSTTVLQPNSYLVLSNAPQTLKTVIGNLPNIIGSFDFGLGGSGDKVRLFDNFGNEVIYMEYSDKSPWPQGADGKGYTLENVSLSTDLNNPLTWFDGCFGGSPARAYNVNCEVGFSSEPLTHISSFYPNPVLNTIYLTISGVHSYELYSLHGLLIQHGTVTDNSLDLSHISKGSYLLKINTESGIKTEKLVKF